VSGKQVITIRYTNHRGETADRRIIPICLRFAATEWHPDEQWLIDAYDVDRQVVRSFALAGIQSRTPPPANSGLLAACLAVIQSADANSHGYDVPAEAINAVRAAVAKVEGGEG